MGSDTKENKSPPNNSSYCVYSNADRSAINTGIFFKTLQANESEITGREGENILIVRASDIKVRRDGKKHCPMTPQDELYFFEICADNRVTTGKGSNGKGHFVDPLLKLYNGVPLMLLRNEDVPNGHAKGTRVTLLGVVLKKDTQIGEVTIDGLRCPCVEAENVIHLVCRSESCGEKIFNTQPKRMSCSLQIPIPIEHAGKKNTYMKFSAQLTQVPVICNSATTGHKLQG